MTSQKKDLSSSVFKNQNNSTIINGLLAFVVVGFIIVGVYFANIDSRVHSIVKDPEFVAAVARRVRPAIEM